MDLNGIQRVTMGKANWFGWVVYYSLDSTMANLSEEFLHTLEPTKDKHIEVVCGDHH
jgi:hypothetical protein